MVLNYLATGPGRVVLLHHQMDRAIELGVPLWYGMDENDFRDWLYPLEASLQQMDMRDESEAQVPLLLVFPHTSLRVPTEENKTLYRRRTLIRSLLFNERPLAIEGELGDPDQVDYLGNFSDVVEVPWAPYLALDVNDGRELCGVVGELSENDPPDNTHMWLKKMGKTALTLDEGLWLFTTFARELKLTHARMLGTKVYSECWADLRLGTQRSPQTLGVCHHDLEEGWEEVMAHRVPYCAERIPCPPMS